LIAEISIDYIGSCLSVNHYKVGKYYTRPETKQWMKLLHYKWIVLQDKHKLTLKLPPTIHLSGIFKDKRSCPDLHNLHKTIGDALEPAFGINDREFRFIDEGYTIDKSKDPMLIIGIEVENNVCHNSP